MQTNQPRLERDTQQPSQQSSVQEEFQDTRAPELMYSTPVQTRNARNDGSAHNRGNAPRRIVYRTDAHGDGEDLIAAVNHRRLRRKVSHGDLEATKHLWTNFPSSPMPISNQCFVNDSMGHLVRRLTFSDVDSCFIGSAPDQVEDQDMTERSRTHSSNEPDRRNMQSNSRTNIGCNFSCLMDRILCTRRQRTRKSRFCVDKQHVDFLDYLKKRKASLKVKNKNMEHFLSVMTELILARLIDVVWWI